MKTNIIESTSLLDDQGKFAVFSDYWSGELKVTYKRLKSFG